MLTLYHPGRRFLTISVTGKRCDLMCRHCEGQFLEHMVPAENPEALLDNAMKLYADGGIGMLVSGGCDPEGRVPITPFFSIFRMIKDQTGLVLNVHTGVIGTEDIMALSQTGADIVSLDVVGSPEVTREIYGITIEPDVYKRMLGDFSDAGLNCVPHVTVGLGGGGESGEIDALRLISEFRPRMVVLNALMGTPHSSVSPAAYQHFEKIVRAAAEILPPETKLGIGCMRPRDLLPPLDLLGTRITALAMPSKSFITELENSGMEFMEKDGCCALQSLDGL